MIRFGGHLNIAQRRCPMARTKLAYAPEYRRQSGEPASQWSWCGRGARRRSWHASSSAPLRRSAIGCARWNETRAVVRTDRRVQTSRSCGGFDEKFASFAKNGRYWQKLQPGSLGRPARYGRSLRAREGEPGPSSGGHDVPGAGRLPQRVLRVARSWTFVPCAARRGVERDDSAHPQRFRCHVWDAAGARGAGGRRMSGGP